VSITWKQALVGGFALASAVATATWEIKHDHISDLESRLEVAEKANSLGYPDLVKQINDASVSLKKQLSELQSIDDLTAEVGSLKSDMEALQAQLRKEQTEHQESLKKVRQDFLDQLEQEKAKAERRNSELAEEVRVLKSQEEKLRKELEIVYSENQSKTLEAGEGTNFAGGAATAGFSSASMENICSTSINGQHKEMKAGDYVEVQSLGRQCKVILESCRHGYPAKASFRFVCAKRSSKP
jgi:hypothetical protein